MREYKVTCDGTVVGIVQMNVSGLYCVIRCTCKNVEGILHLVDRHDDGDYPIGICVPMCGGIGIERKIPIKYMKGSQHEFVLLRRGTLTQSAHPLNTGLSADVLKLIEQCRYVIQNQQPCLLLMSRQECIGCHQSE